MVRVYDVYDAQPHEAVLCHPDQASINTGRARARTLLDQCIPKATGLGILGQELGVNTKLVFGLSRAKEIGSKH